MPNLERKLHEFRDLIGRDAEFVIESGAGGKVRFRGPIKRVIYESPPGELGTWMLAVDWEAIKEENAPFPLIISGAPGRWRLAPAEQDPAEERDRLLCGGIFRTSEIIEEPDGTLVSGGLIIHKPGDNLALESLSP